MLFGRFNYLAVISNGIHRCQKFWIVIVGFGGHLLIDPFFCSCAFWWVLRLVFTLFIRTRSCSGSRVGWSRWIYIGTAIDYLETSQSVEFMKKLIDAL